MTSNETKLGYSAATAKLWRAAFSVNLRNMKQAIRDKADLSSTWRGFHLACAPLLGSKPIEQFQRDILIRLDAIELLVHAGAPIHRMTPAQTSDASAMWFPDELVGNLPQTGATLVAALWRLVNAHHQFDCIFHAVLPRLTALGYNWSEIGPTMRFPADVDVPHIEEHSALRVFEIYNWGTWVADETNGLQCLIFLVEQGSDPHFRDRYNFPRESLRDVLDATGMWVAAAIVAECPTRGFGIHYLDWSCAWDEWIDPASAHRRIAKFGSRAKVKSHPDPFDSKNSFYLRAPPETRLSIDDALNRRRHAVSSKLSSMRITSCLSICSVIAGYAV